MERGKIRKNDRGYRHNNREHGRPTTPCRSGVPSEFSTLIAQYSYPNASKKIYDEEIPHQSPQVYTARQDGSASEAFRRVIKHKANKNYETIDQDINFNPRYTNHRKPKGRGFRKSNDYYQHTPYEGNFSDDENVNSEYRKNHKAKKEGGILDQRRTVNQVFFLDDDNKNGEFKGNKHHGAKNQGMDPDQGRAEHGVEFLDGENRTTKYKNAIKQGRVSDRGRAEIQPSYSKKVRVTSSGTQSDKSNKIRSKSKYGREYRLPRTSICDSECRKPRRETSCSSVKGMPIQKCRDSYYAPKPTRKSRPRSVNSQSRRCSKRRSKSVSKCDSECRTPTTSRQPCERPCPLPSRVKDIPLRYQKKCIPERPRRKPSCVKRKSEIALECPTTINLCPKNQDEKTSKCYPLEQEFLEDPDLPCKCCKCKKKYEQLIVLNPEVQELKVLKNKRRGSTNVNQCNTTSCQPQDTYKDSQNCCCCCDVSDTVYNNSFCDSGCSRSLTLKSYNVCLDPTIADYFYSIIKDGHC